MAPGPREEGKRARGRGLWEAEGRAAWPGCVGHGGLPLLRPSAAPCSVGVQFPSDLLKNSDIRQESEIAPCTFRSGALCAPTTRTPARFPASDYSTITYPPLGPYKNL